MAGLESLTRLSGQSRPDETIMTAATRLPPAPQLQMPSGRGQAMDAVDKAAEQMKNLGKGGKLPPAPQLIMRQS